MNKLTTDIKSLHEETLNNLKTSKASNTLRAYKSDFKDFGGFCLKHNFKHLPTDPKIVSLYLTHLSKTSKMSTLKRRLVSAYQFQIWCENTLPQTRAKICDIGNLLSFRCHLKQLKMKRFDFSC